MASERPRDHSRLPIRLQHVDTKENQWPPDTNTIITSRRSDATSDMVPKFKNRDTVRDKSHKHDHLSESGDGGESATLEQMHRRFQVEIEQCEELDDPLDVYVRYVNWTTEAYSTTTVSSTISASNHFHQEHNVSRESGLFALLEKSIRAFKNEKQYKNDARYVRLNIMYIHMIKDPLPMFKFMMTNGIGSELATFYEEYAAFLEHSSDGRRALEIMRIGIEREARPLQRLKRKLEELQHRLSLTADNSESRRTSSLRTGRHSDVQQQSQQQMLTIGGDSNVTSPSTNGFTGTKVATKLSVYADQPIESSSQGSTSSQRPKQERSDRFPVTVGATGRKERLMVDLVGVYTDGEFQLDELRARLPRYNRPAPASIDLPARPPSRSLFSSTTSHVLSTKMSSSRENTLDFSIRLKGDSFPVSEGPQGGHQDGTRTPPLTRYPAESDLIPRTPPQQVRHAFGATLVPRIELTPGESRKRSLSRNFVASSPTLHSKSAYAEMNKIFSDRSRMSQGSVYWSDDYQEDNTITRTQFSEFGGSSESEQDLEGGSTMTREIQAMKRQRANEAGEHTDIFDRRSSQISVGSRTSTSDITRAIEARGGIALSQESRARASLGKSVGNIEPQQRPSFPTAAEYAPHRSSLSTSSTAFPSLSWTKQPNSFTSAASTSSSSQHLSKGKKPRPKLFEVFRDEQDQDTPDLAESSDVPALGDEEPPSQLDVHGEDDLRDLSWQAENSDLGDYMNSHHSPLKKAREDTAGLLKVSTASMSTLNASKSQASLTTLVPRSASGSFSSILRTVSAPFSGQKSTKASTHTTTSSFARQPSPPRIQELQSLFSPVKSTATSATSLSSKNEDKPTRLSASRLSGGKTVQMQRQVFSNPCFPGSQRVRSIILGRLVPGLKAYAGYYEDLEFIMEHHLRLERSAKRAEKNSAWRHSSSGSGTFSNSSSNNSGGSNGSGGRGYQLGWSSANAESEAVQLGQESFVILRKVGEGGYAKVYGVEAKDDPSQEQRQSTFGPLGSKTSSKFVMSTTRSRVQALKLERPGNPWEFYILSQIHKRFQASGLLRIRGSVIQPTSFYRFKDESYLIMEYCSHGTLLDAVNVCRKKTTSGAMDESLALFFTIELLRVLEGLHVKGIVHGDLKADNCMLRFDSHERVDVAGGDTSAGSSASNQGLVTAGIQTSYDPNGGNGWSRCGVKLIDFGRAIDLTQFDRDMKFRADWPVDAEDCPEIRNEQSWRFQPDYYGLAKIVFTMLTGQEDMPTSEVLSSGLFGNGDSGGSGDKDATQTSSVFDERRYRVSEKGSHGSFVFIVPGDSGHKRQKLDFTLRRYWKQELWRPLFDILLNPSLYRPVDRQWEPCTAALAQVRAWMQQHLTRQRADETRGVRRLLAQLEVLLLEYQKTRSAAR